MAFIAQSKTQAPQAGVQTIAANSKFITAFEYDTTNMRLTTHLKNGAIYQHVFVLPNDWELLKTSQNHSKHWANNIKGKKQVIIVRTIKSTRRKKNT